MVEAVMNKVEFQNQRTLEVLKECENRSYQNWLMLNALVSRDPSDNNLPQFNPVETEKFGQRAAYVPQRRSPWDNRTRQAEKLRSRIAHDRIYNQA